VSNANGSSTPHVELVNVGKRYTKYDDAPMLLTRALKFRPGTTRTKRWAIRGVDLKVDPGETVGVIGRNGSGKSTMLRMLAGVTSPTEGRVSVRGRIAPLISVGVGFHPELTGRENIYVNGSLLGMSRADISERQESIIDFAEIPDFIDTPVKFYSSGMFVRLGFAVAVAAEPDILLVDEVLSVGDIGFQIKSFERMRQMKANGTTILVVSHNLNAIRNLCERVLVVHDGEPKFLGPTDEAISVYHDLLDKSAAIESGQADGRSPVEIQRVDLVDADGQSTAHLSAGQPAMLQATVQFNADVEKPAFSLILVTEQGVPVYIDSTYLTRTQSFTAGQTVTCRIRFPAKLTTGSFTARLGILWDEKNKRTVNSRPILFYVSGRPLVTGITDLEADFDIDATV